MTTILAVDDDPNIVELVRITLSGAGYSVIKAANGKEALGKLAEEVPDLAVVDVMMPEMDGYALTKKLRSEWDIPVLLLTAKGELEDKEKGFLAGSDDYLVKPFEPKELLFRIRAILRRYDKAVDVFIEAGPLSINRQTYEVTIGRKVLLLPLKEFELLSVLASRVNQVFTRDILLDRVWGFDYEGDDQTLNVHIKRLRNKLEGLPEGIRIVTVRGVGYKLEVPLP
ncbi:MULTISPECIES: response regulator transcription factor [Sporosarcina]|uniref:response regulator transcription factor n=1 Tax=Sporosarcina TaxID=1569 RepID=UPI00058C1D39|nr:MULTISPECIES: response regulator transcription factor [Sporosarcina]WJY26702.1 response regulator transcription factor [Sporosarcina sp. 0.2-SM1T-5]